MTDDLTPAQLEQLTGHKRVERQAAALAKLRVPFRHGGGRLYVDRKVVQHWPQWQQTRGEVRLELVR